MRLSPPTLAILWALTLWFALDFVGVDGLVDREPLLGLAGFMLALLLVFLAAGFVRMPHAAPIVAVALLVWLALQVETHWIGYVAEVTGRRLAWYERTFGGHVRVLPARAGHTVPDLYHTVLAVLLVAGLVSAARDTLRRESQ